jgi:hypothetical protein
MMERIVRNLRWATGQARREAVEKIKDYLRAEVMRGEQGFLTSVACLRIGIATTIVIAAFSFPEKYLGLNRTLAFVFLAVFWFVSAWLLYLRVKWPKVFLAKTSKWFQILFDTCCAILLLYIHSDPQSVLYMMFALPALLAGRYVSVGGFLLVWLLIAVSLFASQSHINALMPTPQEPLVLVAGLWFPRMFILSVIAVFAFAYRKVKEVIVEDTQTVIGRQLEIGSEFQATSEIDALTALICRNAVQTIPGARGGVLHLFDTESRRLIPKVTYPADAKVDVDVDIALRCLQERQVISINKVAAMAGDPPPG